MLVSGYILKCRGVKQKSLQTGPQLDQSRGKKYDKIRYVVNFMKTMEVAEIILQRRYSNVKVKNDHMTEMDFWSIIHRVLYIRS